MTKRKQRTPKWVEIRRSAEKHRLLVAATSADWMQVVLNQGPPCFHLDGERFCLRAERWEGHNSWPDSPAIHKFVSLAALLATLPK